AIFCSVVCDLFVAANTNLVGKCRIRTCDCPFFCVAYIASPATQPPVQTLPPTSKLRQWPASVASTTVARRRGCVANASSGGSSSSSSGRYFALGQQHSSEARNEGHQSLSTTSPIHWRASGSTAGSIPAALLPHRSQLRQAAVFSSS
ncbi:unnamed protein product, partial [Ectocarpus sp. 4 AP-2014]